MLKRTIEASNGPTWPVGRQCFYGSCWYFVSFTVSTMKHIKKTYNLVKTNAETTGEHIFVKMYGPPMVSARMIRTAKTYTIRNNL